MLRDSVICCLLCRSYVPTSNTAAHDNHEKISSWVSFSLYGYGAPLGGRSSAITCSSVSKRKSDIVRINADVFAY